MEAAASLRRGPFVLGGALLAIVTLAVMRLPETFVEQVRRSRPFDISTSGWVYRLLVLAAFCQAVYVGFALLRPERVSRAWHRDERLARLGKREVIASVARNAVGLALLTIVYGLSAFALTGERAGYWLFFAVCLGQLAWYFREVGQLTSWIEFQPEFAPSGERGVALRGTSEQHEDDALDHTPPLARGVSQRERESGG